MAFFYLALYGGLKLFRALVYLEVEALLFGPQDVCRLLYTQSVIDPIYESI